MSKIYILSEHPDREVEQAIHDMPADKLRIALYGVARGWGFDEAMGIATYSDTEKSAWLANGGAVEQSVHPTGGTCPVCGRPTPEGKPVHIMCDPAASG